ncbi:hypothetical protein [Micromonospora foliorum]|uniref:hypothetical protein n=1 Tax=Micromonospora foliorum TaxID=2911210 RepID=UPI001EE883E9|nr:hypothetical protein [Micromonospora foliorum]MCG5434852.1 hypothetical protein [Micromonospora foliorum]
MPKSDRTVTEILAAARQTMEFARLGQEDFLAGGQRRLAGLHTAITNARSVTFVLQGLLNKLPDAASWYAESQATLKDDPICKWFVELRNKIEKQGSLGQPSRTVDFLHVGPAFYAAQPPGTVSTFIGDELGRSGHVVRLADGSETRIYVQLPPEMAQVSIYLDGAPNDLPIEDLLGYYLTRIEGVLVDAERRFGA